MMQLLSSHWKIYHSVSSKTQKPTSPLVAQGLETLLSTYQSSNTRDFLMDHSYPSHKTISFASQLLTHLLQRVKHTELSWDTPFKRSLVRMAIFQMTWRKERCSVLKMLRCTCQCLLEIIPTFIQAKITHIMSVLWSVALKMLFNQIGCTYLLDTMAEHHQLLLTAPLFGDLRDKFQPIRSRRLSLTAKD